MFIIDSKSNKIILTKQDTATIALQIVDLDGNAYTLQSGDTVYFTVRKTPSSSTYAFQKTLTSDSHFIINPTDTASMEPGLYMYVVELTNSQGAHYTIIPPSFFQLQTDMGV